MGLARVQEANVVANFVDDLLEHVRILSRRVEQLEAFDRGNFTPMRSLMFSNTLAEETVFERIIPANTLGDYGELGHDNSFTIFNNTGLPRNVRFRVYLGSTTVFDRTEAIAASAANRVLVLFKTIIANAASPSAQRITVEYRNTASQASGTLGAWANNFGLWTTSAVDTTVAQTFKITLTMAVADVNLITRMGGSFFIEPSLLQA